MQRDVLPIVYEDKDPAKIRAAFAAGCGGVIVNNKLPVAVIAEMNNLEQDPSLLQWLRNKNPALLSDKDDPRRHGWSRDVPQICETLSWLEEQYLWSVAARFHQSGLQKKDRSYMMVSWFGDELELPWHIDKNRSIQEHPDMHVHVHGPGIVVASPPRSIKLPFNQLNGSPYLQVTSESLKGESVETYLQGRGCQLIALQPGQTLFLKEGCLHKSAPLNAPMNMAALKCRAAAF